VPALIVVGGEDVYTPVDQARRTHSLVPHSTLAVVEDAGHLPNLERPAEFDQAVLAFLGGAGLGSTPRAA